MKIISYGFFVPTQVGPIFHYHNEDGLDWYEIRNGLMEWKENGEFVSSVYPTWATAAADGTILNVEFDPSRLIPDNRRVLAFDAAIEDVKEGMVFSGTALLPAPPPPVVLPTISDRQFAQQLAVAGIISKPQALAFVKTGEIPEPLQALLEQIPDDEQFDAEMKLSGATTFDPADDLTATFQRLFGWTDETKIAFWLAAAQL